MSWTQEVKDCAEGEQNRTIRKFTFPPPSMKHRTFHWKSFLSRLKVQYKNEICFFPRDNQEDAFPSALPPFNYRQLHIRSASFKESDATSNLASQLHNIRVAARTQIN